MKKALMQWLVKVTHGWNKEFHEAIEANISAEFKRLFPNETDLSKIEERMENMRTFYYVRMVNTAMLLVGITSLVIASAAFATSLAPSLHSHAAAPSAKSSLPGLACVIDWPGTASFLKDIIISVATIITAIVAYKGISKWRGEESGKVDFELSRRIGKAIFRMRDVMKSARVPLVLANEFPEGYDPFNETSAKKAAAWVHVFNGRWAPVRDCAIDIQSLRNEGEALWGRDIVTKLNKLLALANKLQVAMGAYISNEHAEGQHFAKSPDFGKSVNARLFDTGNEIKEDGSEGEPNAFTTDLETTVTDAAAYLRTKLPQAS